MAGLFAYAAAGALAGAGKGLIEQAAQDREDRLAELKQQREDQRAKEDRDFRAGESQKDRDLRIGESEKDRQFRTGEREDSQKFQSGEGEKGRRFQSSEADKGREFTAGENEAGRGERREARESEQDFQHREKGADRTFQSGEADKGREFTAGENEANRGFSRAQTEGQQDFQHREAEAGRKFQGGEAEKGRTFQKEEREAGWGREDSKMTEPYTDRDGNRRRDKGLGGPGLKVVDENGAPIKMPQRDGYDGADGSLTDNQRRLIYDGGMKAGAPEFGGVQNWQQTVDYWRDNGLDPERYRPTIERAIRRSAETSRSPPADVDAYVAEQMDKLGFGQGGGAAAPAAKGGPPPFPPGVDPATMEPPRQGTDKKWYTRPKSGGKWQIIE